MQTTFSRTERRRPGFKFSLEAGQNRGQVCIDIVPVYRPLKAEFT